MHHFVQTQNAHNTSREYAWSDRSGWQDLYSASSSSSDGASSSTSNAAQAACTQLQQQQQEQELAAADDADAAATSSPPFFCSWVGVHCNATVFNSTCSSTTASTAAANGIDRIQIISNNLSGNISSPGFMSALQLLHDCGLRVLVLGGGYGELRGQLGPGWGRLSHLQGLGLFTTNITGPLPAEIGNLTGVCGASWVELN